MSELAPTVAWLRPLQGAWPAAVVRLLEQSPAVVRVVIASIRGSTPREAGACLLITADAIEGTVGGGHLEHEAIQQGRVLLEADEGQPAVRIHHFILGPDLRQCCGGSVQLWLERFTQADLPLLQAVAQAAQSSDTAMLESDFDGVRVTRCLIDPQVPKFTLHSMYSGVLLERLSAPRQKLWLFGAGHVGQAIIRALSDLPFDVTWVDSRPDALPTSLPSNVRTLNEPHPTELVPEVPGDAMYLVLTHDHALDYSLCRAILQRNAFAWSGLIGSQSKAASFRSRLRKDGIAPERIAKLVCPIGIAGIESKAPAAIAIAVAAQLLQTLDARAAMQADSQRARAAVGGGSAPPVDRAIATAAASNPARYTAAAASVGSIKVRIERVAVVQGAHECDGEHCDRCASVHEKSS